MFTNFLSHALCIFITMNNIKSWNFILKCRQNIISNKAYFVKFSHKYTLSLRPLRENRPCCTSPCFVFSCSLSSTLYWKWHLNTTCQFLLFVIQIWHKQLINDTTSRKLRQVKLQVAFHPHWVLVSHPPQLFHLPVEFLPLLLVPPWPAVPPRPVPH